ncbi:MAG TPA: ferritin, partial [Polyangiaceae bacterium]|nr:ferritin [Polyangiaceae bacterium]
REEIEAVDWYNQRVALTSDATLAAILAHNRDEEIEHACMTLEWLRRAMPAWDAQLRKYLFASEPVISDTSDADDRTTPARGPVSLGIGSLKGAR